MSFVVCIEPLGDVVDVLQVRQSQGVRIKVDVAIFVALVNRVSESMISELCSSREHTTCAFKRLSFA